MNDLDRLMSVREVEDFSILALDRHAIPAHIIAAADFSRSWDVYPRKSQKNDKTNYLEIQENLPRLLLAAGVPEHMIYVYTGRDHNISGSYSPNEREDMAALKARLLKGETGTVCMSEIARLHRDWTAVDATEFASIMDIRGVKVLAQIGGEWKLLDMARPEDNKTYRAEAQRGADELLSIVSRLVPSRVNAITKNGGHGNGAAAFGLVHVPRQNRFQSGTGQCVSAHREKYPPHIEIKKKIMRAGVLPHINSYPALQEYCREHQILIAPYEEDVRAIAHPASMLIHVGKIEVENGKRIKRCLPPDFEPFVPKITMLRNILLDTWVLGDVRYGSGARGAQQIKALARKSERDNRAYLKFRTIQPARPAIRKNDPLLSMEEDDPELISLFWENAAKWSRIDIAAAREKDYKFVAGKEPVNRLQSAGKSAMKRPRGTSYTNWWAGVVTCLKHAWADGKASRTHTMRIFPDGGWACDSDHMKDKQFPRCTNYSASPQLREVLDTHFLKTIREVITSGGPLLGNLQREHLRLTEQRMLLQKNQKIISETIRRQEKYLFNLYEGWIKAEDEAAADEEMNIWRAENLTPLYTQRATIQRELDEVARRLDSDDTVGIGYSEEQIRRKLTDALANWSSLSVERRRHLICILVDSVGVLCGPGYDTCETLIAFRWANGMTNYLVGWRAGTMDYREWETWEDDALRRFWPASSGAGISEIRAALRPGRKVSYMERRARELGFGKTANRSIVWRNACKDMERSYGKRNPTIQYLMLPLQPENTLDLRECLAVRNDNDEWMTVPEEVSMGVQALVNEFARDCFRILTDERSPPPADTSPVPGTWSKMDGYVSTRTCRTA